ncbi:hypothetical protein EDB83DRAFT_2549705 [Lactarius deliciosus]|nr:hypothetical protein EDB83DRAFT_2549705 [Lactarius deliciosus]
MSLLLCQRPLCPLPAFLAFVLVFSPSVPLHFTRLPPRGGFFLMEACEERRSFSVAPVTPSRSPFLSVVYKRQPSAPFPIPRPSQSAPAVAVAYLPPSGTGDIEPPCRKLEILSSGLVPAGLGTIGTNYLKGHHTSPKDG